MPLNKETKPKKLPFNYSKHRPMINYFFLYLVCN